MSNDCTSTGAYGDISCGAEGFACHVVLSKSICSSEGWYIKDAFHIVEVFVCEYFDYFRCCESKIKIMTNFRNSKSSKSKDSEKKKKSKNIKSGKSKSKDSGYVYESKYRKMWLQMKIR